MDTKRVFVILSEYVNGADEMLDRIYNLAREGAVDLTSAATIIKEADGSVHVNDRNDVQGGEGTFAGAVAGGIVGALVGGIPGAIVGTGVGAVTGGTTASVVDMGMDRTMVENIAADLKPNSSALVVVVDDDLAPHFETTIGDQFGSTVKRYYYDVRDEVAQQWNYTKNAANDLLD